MSFNVSSIAQKVSTTVRLARAPTNARLFHSPYAVLGNSPLTTPSTASENRFSAMYEKQYDHPPEPTTSHSGYRTYVVSEPDENYGHYRVPAGAYPTSSPYIHFQAAHKPDTAGARYSSTSGNQFAHPFTTRAAPQHKGGVGESAAIRHKSAPGEMGSRGGSFGGMKLMDKDGTTFGTNQLAERNPPPDGSMAETYSKAGIENAWKLRN